MLQATRETPESVPLDFLLVDDDDLILEIVGRHVRKSLNSYRMFLDSDEAMEYLIRPCSVPRVLVVDFYMPKISGIDFFRTLQSRVDLSDCDVYLCSGIAPTQMQLAQLLELGVGLLEKSAISDSRKLLALLNSE